MRNVPGSSVLVISFDLDRISDESSVRQQKNIESIARTLRGWTRQQQIPATWSSRNPAAAEEIAALDDEPLEHEIALWTAGCLRSASPRTRLSQLLTRAQAAGLAVSTLALTSDEDASQLDGQVARKLGITAVRSSNDAAQAACGGLLARLASNFSSQPTAQLHPTRLRYGLWDFPATVVHPWQGRAGGASTLTSPRRWIDRLIRYGWYLHVVVDVPLAAQMGAASLRPIEQLLRFAGQAALAGALRLETVRTLASRMTPVRMSAPAQSILKRRAA